MLLSNCSSRAADDTSGLSVLHARLLSNLQKLRLLRLSGGRRLGERIVAPFNLGVQLLDALDQCAVLSLGQRLLLVGGGERTITLLEARAQRGHLLGRMIALLFGGAQTVAQSGRFGPPRKEYRWRVPGLVGLTPGEEANKAPTGSGNSQTPLD